MKMKVLFLGGVFADENEQEIIDNSLRAVEYSANVFQKKLIDGFQRNYEDFRVVSAPFIGAYPIAYKKAWFKGFSKPQTAYSYVHFNNAWGIRNFSRANALKKAIKDFIQDEEKEKQIIVYSVHTPFLEAAAYAKRKDPNIHVSLIAPDLPQYMNLEKQTWLYRIAKYFDIKRFNKYNKQMDAYVLLTEAMTELLDVHGRPYVVQEGIMDERQLKECAQKTPKKAEESGLKYVVYTGKLYEKFGVKNLVDAFCKIENPNYRLTLCGNGDCVAYIQEKAKQDERILFMGQVTPTVAEEWMKKAAVLVNPRTDNEVYTKYSFPSKTVEYLRSGNPVVGYKLAGMKDCYRDFLCVPKDDSVDALSKTIASVVAGEVETQEKFAAFQAYMQELSAQSVYEKIEKMRKR